MLSTIISWTSALDLTCRVRLDVGRVRDGAVADYNARLVDEVVGEQLASAEVKRYPRWSEPTAGLIARSLHYCTTSGTPTRLRTVQPVRTVQVKIGLVPGGRGSRRELLQLTADFPDTRTPVLYCDEECGGVWERGDVRIGSYDPLRLVVQVLSQWLWGTPHPSAWPAPLQVPEQRSGDLAFVRIRDIPEPARSAFCRRMNGATVPVIEGEQDIAYVSDWDDFVEGRR